MRITISMTKWDIPLQLDPANFHFEQQWYDLIRNSYFISLCTTRNQQLWRWWNKKRSLHRTSEDSISLRIRSPHRLAASGVQRIQTHQFSWTLSKEVSLLAVTTSISRESRCRDCQCYSFLRTHAQYWYLCHTGSSCRIFKKRNVQLTLTRNNTDGSWTYWNNTKCQFFYFSPTGGVTMSSWQSY